MAGDRNGKQEYTILCDGIDLQKEEALITSIEAHVLIRNDKDGLPARSYVNCPYLKRRGFCEAMASQYGTQQAWEFRLPHCSYRCSPKNTIDDIVAKLKGIKS